MHLPHKFLCRFPLKLGATVFGAIMLIVHIASSISAIYQVVVMKNCEECGKFAWRNAYAISVISCLFCIIMLIITCCYLLGLKRERKTVTLIWLVMTGLWLFQSTALLIVLVCIYHSEVGLIGWLLTFIFALLAIGIFIYLYLVAVSYWVQLKQGNQNT